MFLRLIHVYTIIYILHLGPAGRVILVVNMIYVLSLLNRLK